jgi:hypothetical protein
LLLLGCLPHLPHLLLLLLQLQKRGDAAALPALEASIVRGVAWRSRVLRVR